MFLVIDTETTGLTPETAEVLELAAVALDNEGLYRDSYQALIRPTRHIPPETSAVHHLTHQSFESADDSLAAAWVPILHWPVDVYVAHNSAFDQPFLKSVANSAIPWLCTWRCALALWPNAPGHSNQTLRYWLELEPFTNVSDPPHAHRALYDALTTAAVLRHMLGTHTVEQLLDLQHRPVLLKKVRFGKHRDMLWSDVPRDYLEWVLRQDFDADVRYTAQHWLEGEKT